MRDRSILAQPRRGLIYDLLAPPLILATPFVSFVNHNDYSLGAAEIWISLAGLIAAGVLCGLIMAIGGAWLRIVMTAGLVILFVDLQFNWLDVQPRLRIPVFAIGVVLLCWVVRDHLSRIAASVFVMMLVAALALPGPSGDRTVTNSDGESNSRASSRSAPPVLVHLIFDGFIGVEGIPSDLANGRAVKDQLQSFFHSNGFYLFGGAYSRFDLTKYAIPSTLSYGSVSASDTVESVRRVRDNKYFQEMHERGYDIHVYQTEFMDFCTGYEPQVVSCHTFINNGIKPLQRLRLRPTVKAEISVKIFSRTSVILGILDRNYGRLRRSARVHGYDLPPSVFGRYSLAPDRALQVLDIIADDVARAPAGQMFFAHLLVPHRPFILDGACQLRDPSTWDVQSG